MLRNLYTLNRKLMSRIILRQLIHQPNRTIPTKRRIQSYRLPTITRRGKLAILLGTHSHITTLMIMKQPSNHNRTIITSASRILGHPSIQILIIHPDLINLKIAIFSNQIVHSQFSSTST